MRMVAQNARWCWARCSVSAGHGTLTAVANRGLPDLSPAQVVAVQDSLLANADRLLTSALAVLELGNVGLARSLAILGMEESGKAIAMHERRVQMAYAPEGQPFVHRRPLCDMGQPPAQAATRLRLPRT